MTFATIYNHRSRSCMNDVTSTSIPGNGMLFIVLIDPSTSEFILSAHPELRINEDDVDIFWDLIEKWNGTGCNSTLFMEKEIGLPMPRAYRVSIRSVGVAPNDGMDKQLWIDHITSVGEDMEDALETIESILIKNNMTAFKEEVDDFNYEIIAK